MSSQSVPLAKYKRLLKRATVLKYSSEGYSNKQIAGKLNCCPSGIRKLRNRMQKDGLITKTNLLSTAGKNLVERFLVGGDNVPPKSVPSETVRLHDLVIKCKVQDPEWEMKRECITDLNIKGFRRIELNHTYQQCFPYDLGTTVRLTSKSVLIKTPDVYASTPIMAKEEALKIFYTVRKRLEELLKVSLRKRAEFNFCVVSSQHVAFIYDELAKYFLREDITLRIHDEKGKLLWVVDDSHGLQELEAVHKAKAEDVGDIYKNFLFDLSKGQHKPLSKLSMDVTKLETNLHSLHDILQKQTEVTSQIVDYIISRSSPPKADEVEWN